jgi:hypothetical protein
MSGVVNNHSIPACAGMTCLGLSESAGVLHQAARGRWNSLQAALFSGSLLFGRSVEVRGLGISGDFDQDSP